MVRHICAALALVFVVAPVAHAEPAKAVDKFSHEGWAGEAVYQDGKFRQCNMWESAINNWDLGFALEASGELRLGLRNQKIDHFWDMVFSQQTAARIQIDQGPVLIKAFTV